ncbi:MAG: hypothetical protein LBB74_05670 [Chitinispirillales bacterium]|jgi:hypothetical protein|nr:hypothetical protein [Chitinispirillales bacterium]
MIPRTISILILCGLPLNLYVYAIDITDIIGEEKEIEVYLRTEYNRGFGGCGDLSVIGNIKPRKIFTVRAGLSAGNLSTGVDDIKAFSSADADPFSNIPLRFSLLYTYNGLLYYDVHTHSILPVVSYGIARVRVSYGPNFRFTSFFGETAQRELINSFSVYVNIINGEKRQMEAVVGNFCDFYARNMGAYSLKVNYAVFITGNWTVVNEVELLQSGSDALAADFYGLAWRGGAKYSW